MADAVLLHALVQLPAPGPVRRALDWTLAGPQHLLGVSLLVGRRAGPASWRADDATVLTGRLQREALAVMRRALPHVIPTVGRRRVRAMAARGGADVARFTWLTALQVAFGMWGKNSPTSFPRSVPSRDQGSPCTSLECTGRGEATGIRINMDGRGRALDNVFVERLWRTVKQEEVYLKEYHTPREATHTSDTSYPPACRGHDAFGGGGQRNQRPPSYWQELETGIEQSLEASLQRIHDVGLQGETLIVHGVPFQSIIDPAKDKGADLIVMGTHGRTGLSHALMGSVAEKVMRLAPCPVLVTRGNTEASDA